MSEPFLGQITMFGGNFAPRSWALCHGQLLPIAQNQSLFSILGTLYGGDGRTTFGLPDLRGRTAIHPNGILIALGQRTGSQSVALSTDQIPAHTHAAAMHANTGAPDATDPTGNVVASAPFYQEQAPNIAMNAGAATADNAGSGGAHDNMQPFLTINYIIALAGTFPSRN